MREPRKNSPEQIKFAQELQEMNGVNLLDGRYIASSVALHHTAEMKRAEHRKNMEGAVDRYLAGGGKITKVPYGECYGWDFDHTVKPREFPPR